MSCLQASTSPFIKWDNSTTMNCIGRVDNMYAAVGTCNTEPPTMAAVFISPYFSLDF